MLQQLNVMTAAFLFNWFANDGIVEALRVLETIEPIQQTIVFLNKCLLQARKGVTRKPSNWLYLRSKKQIHLRMKISAVFQKYRRTQNSSLKQSTNHQLN